MNFVLGILALLAILVVAGGLLALAVSAVRRDTHGTSGTLSSAALELQSLLEPEKKKVIETMQAREERAESDESSE